MPLKCFLSLGFICVFGVLYTTTRKTKTSISQFERVCLYSLMLMIISIIHRRKLYIKLHSPHASHSFIHKLIGRLYFIWFFFMFFHSVTFSFFSFSFCCLFCVSFLLESDVELVYGNVIVWMIMIIKKTLYTFIFI